MRHACPAPDAASGRGTKSATRGLSRECGADEHKDSRSLEDASTSGRDPSQRRCEARHSALEIRERNWCHLGGAALWLAVPSICGRGRSTVHRNGSTGGDCGKGGGPGEVSLFLVHRSRGPNLGRCFHSPRVVPVILAFLCGYVFPTCGIRGAATERPLIRSASWKLQPSWKMVGRRWWRANGCCVLLDPSPKTGSSGKGAAAGAGASPPPPAARSRGWRDRERENICTPSRVSSASCF
jgi:hypothetical protein